MGIPEQVLVLYPIENSSSFSMMSSLAKAVYKKHAGIPPADPKHPVDHIEIPVAPQSPLEMPDVPGDVPLHRHIPLLHPFFD